MNVENKPPRTHLLEAEASPTFFWNIYMPSLYFSAFSTAVFGFLDRTKILLQTQRSNPLIPPADYCSGAIHTIYSHVNNGTFLGLYRGSVINILRLSVYRCYEYNILRYPEVFLPYSICEKMNSNQLVRPFILGATATLMMLLVQPLDVIWTLVAGQPYKSPNYQGFIHSLYKIIRNRQYTHLYRGFLPNLSAYLLHKGTLYGGAGAMYINQNVKWDQTLLLTIFIPWAISYPFDTIARRMFIDTSQPKDKLIGARELAKKIFIKEGISGFYQGGFIQFFKSSVGAIFAAYSFSNTFGDKKLKWSVE